MTEPIERDLRLLADRLDTGAAPLAEDLRRGRHREARRRLVVGGAVAVTAAVLVLGTVVLPGGGDRSAVGPADGATGPTGPTGPTATDAPSPTPDPGPDPTTAAPGPDGSPAEPVDDPAMMVRLRSAVAGHLDPGGRHISAAEVRQANSSGTYDGDGRWSSVEQKIGWTNPGQDGLGLVTVGVRTSYDVQCGGHGPGGPSATCTEVDLAGLPVTLVEEPDVGSYYAYRRADGYVTTIGTDLLYGNNSQTPVEAVEVTDAQLAAVLTDPALDIPGHPDPVGNDDLPGVLLRDVARDVLGTDAIAAVESWAGDVGGYWSADVRGDDVVGRTQVSADGTAYDVQAPCDPTFAARCTSRVVDGRTVRVDYRLAETGGGFDVTYDGLVRDVWVQVSADASGGVPVRGEVALRLATDPRLQEQLPAS